MVKPIYKKTCCRKQLSLTEILIEYYSVLCTDPPPPPIFLARHYILWWLSIKMSLCLQCGNSIVHLSCPNTKQHPSSNQVSSLFRLASCKTTSRVSECSALYSSSLSESCVVSQWGNDDVQTVGRCSGEDAPTRNKLSRKTSAQAGYVQCSSNSCTKCVQAIFFGGISIILFDYGVAAPNWWYCKEGEIGGETWGSLLAFCNSDPGRFHIQWFRLRFRFQHTFRFRLRLQSSWLRFRLRFRLQHYFYERFRLRFRLHHSLYSDYDSRII